MEHGRNLQPENTSIPRTLPPARSLPVWRKDHLPISMLQSKGHVPRFQRGNLSLHIRGRVICTPWRGKYKNTNGAWLYWKRWTTENQFARAATSISRWWPGIFTIMLVGRNFCRKNFRTIQLAES